MKHIASALAKAQTEMTGAAKSSTNPHFRSKYADLGAVMDACLSALNNNGIALVQPTTDDESGRYVTTMLIHGESGETLECRVPLIVQKNDMQGYGSAVTYARRYGLMAMAGIAPEDDDGNAAAKAAPQRQQRSNDVQRKSPQREAMDMRDRMLDFVKTDGAIAAENDQNFQSALSKLKTNNQEYAAEVEVAMQQWHDNNKAESAHGIEDDEIPHQE